MICSHFGCCTYCYLKPTFLFLFIVYLVFIELVVSMQTGGEHPQGFSTALVKYVVSPPSPKISRHLKKGKPESKNKDKEAWHTVCVTRTHFMQSAK